MADEIKLKAPTVEQQVVVNINGEDKLKSFADTLDKISNNKNLQKYWKTQQDLINAVADAYGNFQKKASKDNATELIKVTNALKAMSGTDLSHILPDFDKISKSMAEAQKVAGNIDSAFSAKGFKEAFDSFETLKAYGTDVQKLFSHFGVSSDIGELQQDVRLLEGEVEKLTRKLSNARNANEELRNEFENFKVGSGFADKLDELDNLKSEMSYIREQAEKTFNEFLELNNITRQGYDINGNYDDNRFKNYFENIQSGYYTASEAIAQFKSEYAYLLEDSYKSSGDSFGLDQLQAFSTKLDSIFHQVEETSNKINDIISNGVIAKSVQNLSEDTTLSDSQRSIFGNILQDEESLKSITALFQKLIDETNQTKNTEVFNTEQFTKIESLFTSIESSLSSIKGVLVDVGDGEELSPLLSEINNIQTAIGGLSSSLNNLHFNMNIDMGTDNQMDAKIQEKAAKALNAYEKLFNGLKMSGYGGEVVNNKFFDFDINKFDTTIGKVKAYKDIIERLRKEAKEYYSGADLLRTQTDDKLWRSASSAGGQLTQAINETAKSKADNPLTELFGKTDLSGVIEQLNTIVSKLDEISVSAKGFTETFKNGLNVNASVEEIEKLTNRVKVLESELVKIKTPTAVTTDQTKDAFPKTSENLEQVAQSEQKVQQEAVATDKALDNISFAPNTEGFDDIIAKFGILREQAEQITKIVKTTKQTADGTPDISYKATLRNGNSYYLGENSTNANETVYDAKADNAKKLEREKQIWNELTTSLDRYATIQKRIASNNALSTDNEEVTKLLEHIHELQRNDILPTEKLTASNEKLQQINQTVTDLKAKLKGSTLDSLQGSIDKYQKIYNQRSTYSSDFTPSEQYTKNLTELNTAIKNLVEYRNALKNVGEVTVEQEAHLKGLVAVCEKASDSFKSLSSSEKGASQIAVDKLVQRINKDLDECTNYSKEAKLGLRALRDELESANPRNLKEITSEIINIENAEIKAGRAGRSFFDTLKNSGFHQIAAQMAGMFGFYDVINLGKQAISAIVDLDDALLDLKKTTSMSSTELNNFYYSANDVAKQMGVTTKSIIEQASAWSRLGYSSNEQATEMAKLSSKFASISPGMDTDQAQEGMVSIMKAWQINPEDVEKEILDPINQLGNKFAESNDDIVEGMKRSAAALAAVGTDYKDAYSLFTGIQEVLQNSEVAGRALRSISMRIRGYDENSEDGFEQTDEELKNITGDLIDLTKTAEHSQGVSVFKEGSTTEFKSLVDYFGEIHDIWDEMSQKQQNDFLQKAFGKTQAQAGSALIQNYDAVKEALAEIDESAGSADKEMSTVEQTLSYKINALKETWVGCAQQILDRGDLGIAISGLNGVSKVITGLIDNVGLLKTAAMGVAAAFSFKNVGILELN